MTRDALEPHLEAECVCAPATCRVPGCEVTLPLREMLDHQMAHQLVQDDDENDRGYGTPGPSHSRAHSNPGLPPRANTFPVFGEDPSLVAWRLGSEYRVY
jgi:hypothetical protein